MALPENIEVRSAVISRFAPSPTGYLHLGHAASALLSFEAAKAADGRFLLRIEDIDAARCRPEFETAIYEDLAWLGLDWQKPVLRQSERLATYEAKLTGLAERGLVYRCFKTRRDIEEAMSAPHGAPEGVFKGAALSALEERDARASGRAYAWRLSLDAVKTELGPMFETLTLREDIEGLAVERPADPTRFGDVVLGRKDSGASYHLASVIDDAAQGVTHVVRGEDLREAAGLHRLLQALLGLPTPIYRHHRLLTSPEGKRLSKRDGAASIRALREAGHSAAEVRAMAMAGCDGRSVTHQNMK